VLVEMRGKSHSNTSVEGGGKRGKKGKRNSSENGQKKKKIKSAPLDENQEPLFPSSSSSSQPFSFFIHLPKDLFRLTFQFLSLDDLMEMDKAFLENQELLSHWNSSLEGTTISEIFGPGEEKYDWVESHKILNTKLVIRDVGNLERLFTPTLTELTLDRSDGDLSEIARCPSLTTVSFQNCTELTLISFLMRQPQLESLDIKILFDEDPVEDILLCIANSCPNLNTVHLEYNEWVTDESILSLIQGKGCPKLKYLDIGDTEIEDPETIRLLINSFPNLSYLCFWELLDAPDDIITLFLRNVIFRSILSDDRESQSNAIQCLFLYWETFLGKLPLSIDCYCLHHHHIFCRYSLGEN
jgi:hypothetical protein